MYVNRTTSVSDVCSRVLDSFSTLHVHTCSIPARARTQSEDTCVYDSLWKLCNGMGTLAQPSAEAEIAKKLAGHTAETWISTKRLRNNPFRTWIFEPTGPVLEEPQNQNFVLGCDHEGTASRYGLFVSSHVERVAMLFR